MLTLAQNCLCHLPTLAGPRVGAGGQGSQDVNLGPQQALPDSLLSPVLENANKALLPGGLVSGFHSGVWGLFISFYSCPDDHFLPHPRAQALNIPAYCLPQEGLG